MDWHGYISLLEVSLAIFIAIAIGIWIRKLNWLTEAADGSLLRLTNNVLLPALILDSVLKNHALKHPANLLLAPATGLFTVALGMSLAFAAGKYLGKFFGVVTQNALWSFVLCLGIYSFNYVPLALAKLLFNPAPSISDTTGVLLAFNLGIEISLWTVGMVLLGVTGVLKGWKKILNPPLVTIVLGLLINALNLDRFLPRVFFWTTGLIGQCAIPLGLILIGATLMDNWNNFQWRGGIPTMLVSCALRLGILPILFLLLARYVPFCRELKEVLVVQSAMPAAVVPTLVMIRYYGSETTTAMRAVVGTSVIGLFTIPIWIWFGLDFVLNG